MCGFTRETLIASIINIESREWRRREIANAGLPPENPRASFSDDVVCFFSCLRDSIGKNFTLKEVQVNFRKVCIGFQNLYRPFIAIIFITIPQLTIIFMRESFQSLTSQAIVGGSYN